MKICVISDTHATSLEDLSKKLLDELTGVELVVHAGDYTSKTLLDELRGLGNFIGVYGNMDSYNIKKELQATQVFEVKGFKVGLTHPAEGGIPFRLEERVRAKFEDVKIIIYGHSHTAKNKLAKGTLYFNPGSATGALPAPHSSFGILIINEKIEGKIIKL